MGSPDIELAVLETARGGLIKAGMAFDGCSVGAVTNVTEDHLGPEEIDTVEEMAEIKSLIPEHTQELLVLNAEDPLCVAMAKRSPARRLCYVSLDPSNTVYRRQIESGGLAAGLEATDDGAMLVLHQSGARRAIVAPESIPAAHGGRARFNLQNAAFASAIAYGLGAGLEEIAAGLTSFTADFASDPGRLNFYEGLQFKVLVDYGHNPGGLQAICDFLRHQEVARERICVLTGSGAQRVGQLHRQAAAVAPHFDRFVCYQTERPHQTKPGEVRQHIVDGLVAAGVAPQRIALAEDRASTVEAALRQAQPGDLLVIFAHYVLQAWRQVERYGREQGLAAR